MTPTKCSHCGKPIPATALIVLDNVAMKTWCGISCWTRSLEAAREKATGAS